MLGSVVTPVPALIYLLKSYLKGLCRLEGKRGYLIKPSRSQNSILVFGDTTDVTADFSHTLNAWLVSFTNNCYPGVFNEKLVLLGRMNVC